jgi:hypothetical protein
MTLPPEIRSREKGPLSFLAFMGQFSSEEASALDFTAIMTGDRSFPNANSWQELRRYLNKIAAPHAAFVGGRLAWREYAAADKIKLQEWIKAAE